MLRPKAVVLLAALAGLLLAISFPSWNSSWDGSYFAFIALIPLFFACKNQSPKYSFLIGWFAGLVYFAGTLYWVTISMHQYGNLPWVASGFFMLLLTSYLALYVGCFALLIGFTDRSFLLLAPLAWVALEYLRGHLLTGFPWNALGYSQYRNLPLIQIADIASVYGVSALVVFINATLFLIIQTAWDKKMLARFPALILFAVLIITLLYGHYRLSLPMNDGNPLRVAVIQGNIDQAIKWSPEAREKTIAKYEQLSFPFSHRADIVIWPEAALPVFFQNEPLYQQRLVELTQKGDFSLLFGSLAFKTMDFGQISLLNSAYLLSPSLKGPSLFRYDKMHLVPFGEYVPLQSALFFVNKMVTGIGDFVPGKKAVVMEIPSLGGIDSKGVRPLSAKIGTAICFEVIFPEVVRQFVQNGANVIVTITNDAWFGHSAAPYQHFSMIVFRAIENRVPFARAANTGISGFIDAHGAVLQSGNLFVDEARLESLSRGFQKTVYTTYGDFFAIGAVIATFIFIGVVVYRMERTQKT
ncbi:MAG: apolipoprotein N-acyltransferase [Nitrospirae bacterium]|nr:apolipoprotein N-acyltransferase [Candidatus Troglogloeales bacterium]